MDSPLNYAINRIRSGKRTISPDTLMMGKYPGLASTARQISDYIPTCQLYVEPFAGLGRVAKLVKAKHKVLNDLSDYACNYNKKFVAEITKEDFEICIKKWDNYFTFFLFDPPWRKQIYENNKLPFCDRTPKEYYQRLYEILPTLKGDWILCMDKSQKERGKIDLNIPYFEKLFVSKKTLFKKKISTFCLSNKPFICYQQEELL